MLQSQEVRRVSAGLVPDGIGAKKSQNIVYPALRPARLDREAGTIMKGLNLRSCAFGI
jgi:hypothetical protein